MPAASTILDSLSAIANHWRGLAIGWHIYFLAALLLLMFKRRSMSTRFATHLLIAPFVSVSAVAWAAGNPFNGVAFAILVVVLIAIAARVQRRRIAFTTMPTLGTGLIVFTVGAVYPHFVEVDHWIAYTFAAPLGLLPCPTLLAVIGVTLMLRGFESIGWRIALTVAGMFYGFVGVFRLGVLLDATLLAAAAVMAATTVADVRRRRFVRGSSQLGQFEVSGMGRSRTGPTRDRTKSRCREGAFRARRA
jgi:hypothetical protein